MKGRKGIASPEHACVTCQVRKRMGECPQCSRCYRSTPTPGHRVTDQQRRTLYELYVGSVAREFRRD